MDTILEDQSEFNDIIINRKQIQLIVGKKFLNDKHWNLFKVNFLYHFIFQSKRNINHYFEFVLDEYQDLISRG